MGLRKKFTWNTIFVDMYVKFLLILVRIPWQSFQWRCFPLCTAVSSTPYNWPFTNKPKYDRESDDNRHSKIQILTALARQRFLFNIISSWWKLSHNSWRERLVKVKRPLSAKNETRYQAIHTWRSLWRLSIIILIFLNVILEWRF